VISQEHDMAKPDRNTRVVAVLLGSVFIVTGLAKLLQLAPAVWLFDAFHLPRWTLMVVGAIELTEAVLVLVGRTRTWGALAICATMGFAALAHTVTAVGMPGLALNFGLFLVSAWLVSRSPPAAFAPDWVHDPHRHAPIAPVVIAPKV
jgi:uncharacterized membrane protein YphA (DoxX/SURF4 family)